jgi:hypothetical protein
MHWLLLTNTRICTDTQIDTHNTHMKYFLPVFICPNSSIIVLIFNFIYLYSLCTFLLIISSKCHHINHIYLSFLRFLFSVAFTMRNSGEVDAPFRWTLAPPFSLDPASGDINVLTSSPLFSSFFIFHFSVFNIIILYRQVLELFVYLFDSISASYMDTL